MVETQPIPCFSLITACESVLSLGQCFHWFSASSILFHVAFKFLPENHWNVACVPACPRVSCIFHTFSCGNLSKSLVGISFHSALTLNLLEPICCAFQSHFNLIVRLVNLSTASLCLYWPPSLLVWVST